MTTKTAAKKWNCTALWVRERCKEGMIPLAEKNVIWNIPDNADKPPCTRHRAVVLMKLLQEKNAGNDVELFPGNDMDTNIAIYKYLSNNGFITKFKGKNIEKAIKSATVLNYGVALIASISEKAKPTVSKKTKYAAEFDAKVFKAGVEHETSTQDKSEDK